MRPQPIIDCTVEALEVQDGWASGEKSQNSEYEVSLSVSPVAIYFQSRYEKCNEGSFADQNNISTSPNWNLLIVLHILGQEGEYMRTQAISTCPECKESKASHMKWAEAGLKKMQMEMMI